MKRVTWLALVSILLIVMTGVGILGCAQQAQQPTQQPSKPAATQPAQTQAPQPTPQKAAAFPTEDVHFIVQAEPGGGYDAYARALAPYLKKNLGGANIVVENKPGGGGSVAHGYTYKSKPDGYTFGFVSLPGDLATTLVKESSYDFKKAVWIGTLVASEFVFYVQGKSPINNLADLVAASKQKELKGAPPRIGDTATLQLVILGAQAGLKYRMIGGFESGKTSMLALARGDLDFQVTSPGGYADDFIKAGDVKPILTTGSSVSTFYPKAQYAGQLGYYVPVWNRSLWAPPGTPADRIAILEAAFKKSCADPELLAWANKTANPVGWISAQETTKMVSEQFAAVEKYMDILKPSLTQ